MLLRLAWWTVRERRTSFAGSFVAMVCAQALVTACAVLWESGHRAGAAQGGPDVVSFVAPFGFICLFVAAFAVAGAFSLSVQQRLREIAVLRAIGATSRQIRRLVAYEAAVVTAMAALPGCALGVLVAVALRARLVSSGALPEGFALGFGPLSLVFAVTTCWLTGEAAVWASGRRASRVQAIEALSEAAVPRRRFGVVRTAAGLAVLAGAVWGLTAIADSQGSDQTNTAASLVLVLMVAVSLLGPWVGRSCGAVFGLVCRLLFPQVGLLVKANLRAGYRRLAAAVVPLALTVAFAAVALFVPEMKWNELERQDNGRLLAQHLVRIPGGEMSSAALATLRGLSATEAAVGVTGTYVQLMTGDSAAGLGAVSQAVSDGPVNRVLDMGVTTGSLHRLGGRDIALSTQLAARAQVRVGEEVRLRMVDSRIERLRVTALYERSRGFGEALIPEGVDVVHRERRRPPDATVYVRSRQGQEDALEKELARLGSRQLSWQVLDRAAYRAEARQRQESSMTVTYLLLGVITLFTAISVVNTLVMTTMERAREFALLRLVGATRRQVVHMMRLENVVTVLAALLVGSAVAAAVLVAAGQALTGSSSPHLQMSTMSLILAGAGVLALATGVVMTRVALHQRPEMALREAE
ncbi:FtsX-like permease family protein [Streptomyces sp. CA2R101]|uniref:FtsX-like permease family protein n=1 Tax=Streptomyces sp. CA2R101 TaxID=3120152 RepID=UPI0030087D85